MDVFHRLHCERTAAHSPFSESLWETCHHEGRVTPALLASWIHIRMMCLTLLEEHCWYLSDSSLRCFPPQSSSSRKISLTLQKTVSKQGRNDACRRLCRLKYSQLIMKILLNKPSPGELKVMGIKILCKKTLYVILYYKAIMKLPHYEKNRVGIFHSYSFLTKDICSFCH